MSEAALCLLSLIRVQVGANGLVLESKGYLITSIYYPAAARGESESECDIEPGYSNNRTKNEISNTRIALFRLRIKNQSDVGLSRRALWLVEPTLLQVYT